MNKPLPFPARRGRQRGVSLVEASVTVGLSAVLAGIAVPSFEQMIERRRVEAVAAQLETDLQNVRSLAVARNETLRVTFAAPRCYVVHSGPAAECTCADDGSASCGSGAEVLRMVSVSMVTLSSNSRSMAFEPIKGTVTPTASVRVVGPSGVELRNVVNLMGRVRSCAPAPGLAQHPTC